MQPATPTTTLNTMREISLRRILASQQLDVLVLGGGVNGAAVLRELSLNGLSAALVDKGDFCNGATSASSRMAHGGLRYLEGREFRLVAESARERNSLIAHAPHFVRPLEIVVPLPTLVGGLARSVCRFLKLTRKRGPLSLVALKGALTLYEYFGRNSTTLPRHRTHIRRAHFPKGIHKGTRAVTRYFDAQITQPEALVMEMLCEAISVNKQVSALNHIAWHREGDAFVLQDKWSRAQHTIRPRLIVNATGGWIDHVNADLGIQTQYLRCIKGAHLVLDNAELFVRMKHRAYYFDDRRGRMVISLPVGRNVLVGTTEVETVEPDDHSIASTEIDYLIDAIDGLFDDIAVTHNQIVSMTTGVRPLRRGSGGSATAAARDHSQELDQIPNSEIRVLSLVGGKWTTFRAFAEQATDELLKQLAVKRKASTATRDYPGAASCTLNELCDAGNVDTYRAMTLLARYGSFAMDIAVYCSTRKDHWIPGNESYSRAEIEWLIFERAACTIEDIALRRTQMTLGRGITPETLQSLGRILIGTIGRNPHDIEHEISHAISNPLLRGIRAAGVNVA